MKQVLKSINVRLMVIVMAFLLYGTVDTYAGGGHHNNYHQTRKPNNCNTVGAPLDGGLLTMLLGAGLVYFGARKRRKEQQ